MYRFKKRLNFKATKIKAKIIALNKSDQGKINKIRAYGWRRLKKIKGNAIKKWISYYETASWIDDEKKRLD